MVSAYLLGHAQYVLVRITESKHSFCPFMRKQSTFKGIEAIFLQGVHLQDAARPQNEAKLQEPPQGP